MLHDEYFLQFGPDGIEFRTAGIDSRIEWKLYRELQSIGLPGTPGSRGSRC
jgi:hypothetical protein